MKGQLNVCQWEASSCNNGTRVVADCECLFAHLLSPSTKQHNKRLAIDFSALIIWNNCDDCDRSRGSKGDYPRWTHVRDAVRLLDRDDDFLLVERNVEYRYF